MSQELVRSGFLAVEYQDAHPVSLKRGMEKALKVVLNYLKSIAMPISQQDELRNLCLISSNGDENISEIIA